MRKAMTLVEMLILVAVLGIVSAIVLPILHNHIQEAKESAAKDDLRVLRSVIALYAAKNKGMAPGYRKGDPLMIVSPGPLSRHLIDEYLLDLPENPFNKAKVFKLIQDGEAFPTQPIVTGSITYGWVYKAATKEIRLNWPGKDSDGVAYFNY